MGCTGRQVGERAGAEGGSGRSAGPARRGGGGTAAAAAEELGPASGSARHTRRSTRALGGAASGSHAASSPGRGRVKPLLAQEVRRAGPREPLCFMAVGLANLTLEIAATWMK